MSAKAVMVGVFGAEHEFWRRDTETAFKTAAIALLGKGFAIDEVITILGSLYVAVSDEYGA